MSRARVLEVAALAAILLTALGLRLSNAGVFIASDELRWTCRSVNFVTALRERDFAETFQVGHPGVLTMWFGGAALSRTPLGDWPELCRMSDGGRDLSALDDVGQEGVLQTITPLLFAARRGPALAGIALLALAYAALRLGRVPAMAGLTGIGLLALDPFLLAHNRILHTDALEALTALLAVCALAAQQVRRPGRARYAALAGAPAGLAMIAKSSALVLAPFALLLLGARVVAAGDRRLALRAAVRDMFGWGAGVALAAFLVWPALWTAPLSTVLGVLRKAQEEGGAPHSGGNFFLGQPVGDPGPLFYPVAAAFRLTPVAAIAAAAAIALAAVWLWRRFKRREAGIKWLAPPTAVQIVALVAWALLFMLALSVGPKKFDRYALPSLAALNVAGGLAVATLALRAAGSSRGLAAAACAVVVLVQGAAAARSLPYGLAYFNPLIGGPEIARRALLVGWGEGYNLAADYLNALPGADQLEVAVPGVANFAPLFAGRTRSAEGYREGRTDYAVLYISKVQRERNEDLLDQFVGLEPEWTGYIAGLPYVSVYRNRTLPALDQALLSRLQNRDVIVADGETAFAKRHGREEAPEHLQRTELVRTWGHWGENEVSAALADELPSEWRRIWVVRYPEHDPDAVLHVLDTMGQRADTVVLVGGVLEVTLFVQEGSPAE